MCLCSTQNQCPVTTSVCMCVELTMAVSTKLNLTRLLVNLRTVPKFRKKKRIGQLAAASKFIWKKGKKKLFIGCNYKIIYNEILQEHWFHSCGRDATAFIQSVFIMWMYFILLAAICSSRKFWQQAWFNFFKLWILWSRFWIKKSIKFLQYLNRSGSQGR